MAVFRRTAACEWRFNVLVFTALNALALLIVHKELHRIRHLIFTVKELPHYLVCMDVI